MAKTIPTIEPQSFTAGETVKWNITQTDYPASLGTLGYFFVSASGSFTESTSTADGDTHQIVITAAASGAIGAGTYSWQARYTVTASGEEYIIGSGTTVVLPEFTDTAYDNRSTAKKALDAIEAVIVTLSAKTKSSMSIAGRSSASKDLMDALLERDKLKAEVASEIAAERIAAGLGSSQKLKARF